MPRIEKLGIGDKYGLRITATDNQPADGVKFTITSAGGKKQHANVTLPLTDSCDVARFILASRHPRSRPPRQS
jgi:hypothetical protein